MTPRRVPAFAALILATVALAACATTNFTDPERPRYVGAWAPVRPLEVQPFTIATFNIRFARHVDRALEVLRSDPALVAADVLVLQEMDSAGVERIARELRFNYVYFPSAIHPWSHREFGCAVLSPWPLDEPKKLPLPHASFVTNVRRAATLATVHRGNQRIRVVAVHLPPSGSVSDEERREQVRLLAESVASSADPVVMAGDFNGRRVGPWLTRLGFTWVTQHLPGTGRALGHWWSYDHVFIRGLEPVTTAPASGVVDPRGASDHRAVWVKVAATRPRTGTTPRPLS